MNEQCIVIGSDVLIPRYIAEDDIPRDGSRWPEYANTMMICIDSFENGLANGRLHNFYFEETDSFFSFIIDLMRSSMAFLLNPLVREVNPRLRSSNPKRV